METNWKDKFDIYFDQYNPIHDNGRDIPVWNGADFKSLKDFIETEIIEKLIDEAEGYFTDDYGMAEELRAKWLGKETHV